MPPAISASGEGASEASCSSISRWATDPAASAITARNRSALS